MRKIYVLFCLLCLAFFDRVYGHEAEKDSVVKSQAYKNSFYIELGGNAIVGSFNYERIFKISAENKKLAFGAGGLFFPVPPILGGKTTYHLVIPVELSFITGSKAVKPEFGFGLSYYGASPDHIIFSDRYEARSNNLIYKVLRLGVRWQAPGNSYFIRAGFTPIFFGKQATDSKLFFMPFYGMSFGKSY